MKNFDVNIVSGCCCLFPSIYFAEDSVAVDIVNELTDVIAFTPRVEMAASKYSRSIISERTWHSPGNEIITRVSSSFKKYIDYSAYKEADKRSKQLLIKDITKSMFANMKNIYVDVSPGIGYRNVYRGSDSFWDEYTTFTIPKIKVIYRNIDQSDIDNAFESLNDEHAMKKLYSTFEL